MSYEVGQKICLWQEEVRDRTVVVLKEVIVTITETKTGVLGEFSKKPVSATSLKGIGDDGKEYDKHWDTWPESQTNSFIGQWSMRDDGEGKYPLWIPQEAVHAHYSLMLHNKHYATMAGYKLERVDQAGNVILPKGDFTHCDKHNEYLHVGQACLGCLLETNVA